MTFYVILQEMNVTLERDERQGLGFTLTGGASTDTQGGCYIRGIIQDPALSDGRLQVGDKLIKVKQGLYNPLQ